MFALTKQKRRRKLAPAWHARFLTMLPAIVTHARITFQHFDPESRAEAMAVKDMVHCSGDCQRTARWQITKGRCMSGHHL